MTDSTPVQRFIQVEEDCEDQGYGSIKDGCVNWKCGRAPIKPDGKWLKCPSCGASYGAATHQAGYRAGKREKGRK